MTAIPAAVRNGTQVTTGEVRASFVNIFQARKNDEGEDRYGMTILIPKSDTASYEACKAALIEAGKAKFGDKFNGAAIQNGTYKWILRDGDKSDRPEHKGHWFASCSSKNRPILVDEDMNEIMDRNGFRSGDYARVQINAYGYDAKKSKGVTFGLNSVQRTRRGPPLAGGPAIDQVFGKIPKQADATADEAVSDDDLFE